LAAILAGCSSYILYHPKQGQLLYTIMCSANIGILMIHLFIINAYMFESTLYFIKINIGLRIVIKGDGEEKKDVNDGETAGE